MKKIPLLLTILVIFISIFTFNVSAADEAPTYSFDTGVKLKDFVPFTANSDLTVKTGVSNKASISGGALEISVDMASTLVEDYSGVQINSSTFGLDSFRGCKMEANVFIPKDAFEAMNFVQIFSYGSSEAQWVEGNTINMAGIWLTLVVKVPDEDAYDANDLLGIKVPVKDVIYNGVVLYVDNVSVYDKDGNKFANDDGYEPPKETTISKNDNTNNSTKSTTKAVDSDDNSSALPQYFIWIIAVVVLVAVAGLIIAIIIIKEKKRFY